jgi:hypothetical protein
MGSVQSIFMHNSLSFLLDGCLKCCSNEKAIKNIMICDEERVFGVIFVALLLSEALEC